MTKSDFPRAETFPPLDFPGQVGPWLLHKSEAISQLLSAFIAVPFSRLLGRDVGHTGALQCAAVTPAGAWLPWQTLIRDGPLGPSWEMSFPSALPQQNLSSELP